MKYEKNMTIFFDVISKKAFVSFRGQEVTLGPFDNQKRGIDAAEAYCRERGWTTTERPWPTVANEIAISDQPENGSERDGTTDS